MVTVTDTRFATNTARTRMEVVASEVVAVVDGGGRSAAAGSTVVLDASRSYDPDGSELTFVWKRDGTPVGAGATLAAEAPAVGAVATYDVHLGDAAPRWRLCLLQQAAHLGVSAARPAFFYDACHVRPSLVPLVAYRHLPLCPPSPHTAPAPIHTHTPPGQK